jgi:c-di-GMP-binding flagellar brake protein YcgR
MADILTNLRKLLKHRQHRRYFVEDGTSVIISSFSRWDRNLRVQLSDISYGGMAFIYKQSQSDLEKSGTLKLLVKTGTYGAKIRFDTVYDITAFGSTQSSEQFRRRGVKFKGMGGYEKTKLRNYLVSLSINPQLSSN